MDSTVVGALVFAVLFGAGLLGVRVRAALPEDHLSTETKDAVKVGMGLVATMAALVLGLVVASTKGAYDAEKGEVTQMAAKIVFLDRVLANYGSETAETRDLLRRSVGSAINRMWPDRKIAQVAQLDPSATSGEAFFNSIQQLSPQNDAQRSLKSQAVQVTTDVGQMRWLLFEQTESSISVAMLIVLIAWLAIIFTSVALFALTIGCASTSTSTQNRENMLVASGFKMITPKTTAQQQKLQNLPPGKVTMIQKGGKTYYVFPDPAHNRAYVGRPREYQAYQQLRATNTLVAENLETAEMYQDAEVQWSLWGGWGECFGSFGPIAGPWRY